MDLGQITRIHNGNNQWQILTMSVANTEWQKQTDKDQNTPRKCGYGLAFHPSKYIVNPKRWVILHVTHKDSTDYCFLFFAFVTLSSFCQKSSVFCRTTTTTKLGQISFQSFSLPFCQPSWAYNKKGQRKNCVGFLPLLPRGLIFWAFFPKTRQRPCKKQLSAQL